MSRHRRHAYIYGVIKSNPLDRIKNIERDADEDSADPFSQEEPVAISEVKPARQQDVNLSLFD